MGIAKINMVPTLPWGSVRNRAAPYQLIMPAGTISVKGRRVLYREDPASVPGGGVPGLLFWRGHNDKAFMNNDANCELRLSQDSCGASPGTLTLMCIVFLAVGVFQPSRYGRGCLKLRHPAQDCAGNPCPLSAELAVPAVWPCLCPVHGRVRCWQPVSCWPTFSVLKIQKEDRKKRSPLDKPGRICYS